MLCYVSFEFWDIPFWSQGRNHSALPTAFSLVPHLDLGCTVFGLEMLSEELQTHSRPTGLWNLPVPQGA